jgi:hypothetical protein
LLIFEVVILKPQVFMWLFGFSPEGGTCLPVCVSQSRVLPQASNQGRSGKSKRPELGFSRIGGSTPGVSCLALQLGELRAFAVSLGRFSRRIRGQSPRFFKRRIDDCRVMIVDF